MRSLLGTHERQQGVITSAYWFVFALCLAHLIRNEQEWRVLFQCVCAGGYIISLLALLHYSGLMTIDNLYQDNDRLSYTIGNASILAAYLACVVPISSGLLASAIQKKRYYTEAALHSAGLLIITTVLVATGTRSAIIAVSLWACVAVLTLPRDIKAPIFGLIFVAALTAAAFNWNLLETRLAELTIESPAVSGRFDAWSIAYRAIKAAPIIGIGAENFIVAFGALSSPGEAGIETFDNPHSHLLDITVSSGITGLACYAALLFACAIALWKHRNPIEQDKVVENRSIIIGVLLIYQMTASVLFEAHVSQALFYLAVAYCLSISPNLKSPLSSNWVTRPIGIGICCTALLHTTTTWSDARAMHQLTTTEWHQHIRTAPDISRPQDVLGVLAPKIWSDWRYLNTEQKILTITVLKQLTDQDPNLNWQTLTKLGYAWLRISADFPDGAKKVSAIANRLLQLAPERWETVEFLAFVNLARHERDAAIQILRQYLEKDPNAGQVRSMLRRLEAP